MPEIEADSKEELEKLKEWYSSKYGIVFLSESWQEVYLEIWAFSRIDRGWGGVEIRDNRVKLKCKTLGWDLLETLEILERMESESND